jgi:catechol-2,3-dioxygenase
VVITGFSEMTLEARDLRALARFYVDAFGLTELSCDHDRIWLAVGAHARLGIWKPGRREFGDEGGRHVHFAFAAEPGELDALARRLRAQGVAIEGPHEHDGGDRSLYVRDPEGNVVEAWDLFQRGGTVHSLRDAAA